MRPLFLELEWDGESYYPSLPLSLVGPVVTSFIQNLQEVEGGEERGTPGGGLLPYPDGRASVWSHSSPSDPEESADQ